MLCWVQKRRCVWFNMSRFSRIRSSLDSYYKNDPILCICFLVSLLAFIVCFIVFLSSIVWGPPGSCSGQRDAAQRRCYAVVLGAAFFGVGLISCVCILWHVRKRKIWCWEKKQAIESKAIPKVETIIYDEGTSDEIIVHEMVV